MIEKVSLHCISMVLFLGNLYHFPPWIHTFWKGNITVALEIQETKIEKQILKLSITAGSGTPLAFFPGGNQRESKPHHQFLEGFPPQRCYGQDAGHSLALSPEVWNQQRLQLHLLLDGNNSVCVQCAEVQLPNRAPLGLAEEGLDNLAHLVSAGLLITVQRQGKITTGNLRSSSHPQG